MNSTTTPDSPDNTINHPSLPHSHPHDEHYYTELIRIVTGLFVGLLALMTFLLTVSLPRPHAFFAWSLYASIIIIALNLIAYVIGNGFRSRSQFLHSLVKTAQDEGKDLSTLNGDWKQARNRLKVARIVQQVLFVAAIVAITCLAMATANFFFSITPSAASGAATQ
jgi:hypothetical protein